MAPGSSPPPAGWIEVENPATEEIIGRVPRCGPAEVDRAVKAARRAFPRGGRSPRTAAPSTCAPPAAVLAQRRDEVARTVTAEMGKPLDEARGEVDKVVRTLFFYAEEAVRVLGPDHPERRAGLPQHGPARAHRRGRRHRTVELPGRAPGLEAGRRAGRGLHAGHEAGQQDADVGGGALSSASTPPRLPPGVVNLLTGDSRMGEALIAHPGVDKIAFTGSQEVGERIFRVMGGIKSVALELGGNCPLLVAPHANLAAAVKGAVRRSFRNMGQICVAINRVYVHRPLYAEFLDAGEPRGAGAHHRRRPGAPVGRPRAHGRRRRPGQDARAHRGRRSARERGWSAAGGVRRGSAGATSSSRRCWRIARPTCWS